MPFLINGTKQEKVVLLEMSWKKLRNTVDGSGGIENRRYYDASTWHVYVCMSCEHMHTNLTFLNFECVHTHMTMTHILVALLLHATFIEQVCKMSMSNQVKCECEIKM